MENIIIEAVKIVNPIQLALIALIGFYYYNRLKEDIKAGDAKLEAEMKALDIKIESKYEALNLRMDNLYQLIFSFFKRDVA